MPVAGSSRSDSSNLLYGAGGAVAGAGAYAVAQRINSAYKLGAWALGIGIVIGALEVVASSDLSSCQTQAVQIAANVQALNISTASTASLTTLSTDVQNLRSQLGLLSNCVAQTAYSANLFAFTQPVQQNFPVQAAAITPSVTTSTNTNSTAIVILGLVVIAALALFLT